MRLPIRIVLRPARRGAKRVTVTGDGKGMVVTFKVPAKTQRGRK